MLSNSIMYFTTAVSSATGTNEPSFGLGLVEIGGFIFDLYFSNLIRSS